MREPTAQTRLFASAPVFFGTWGLGVVSVCNFFQNSDTWPFAVGGAIAIAAVMKADEQVRAWKAWQAEWDAHDGATASPRRPVPVLGLLIGVPVLALLASILVEAGKQGGSQAVIGILMLIGGPLVLIAAFVKLFRKARSPKKARALRAQPVRVCIRSAIVAVPSLEGAYRALPPHCQKLLGRS